MKPLIMWNFSDELSVQLDHHGHLCFRKVDQQRKLNPMPKHPLKVHIWAGISKHGATPVVIFTGSLTSTRYCGILQNTLLPFITTVFLDGHQFQQDNDSKHASNYTQAYLVERSVNWWKTLAESPDLSPTKMFGVLWSISYAISTNQPTYSPCKKA